MNEIPDIKVLTDKRRGLICVSIATRGFLMDDILIDQPNMKHQILCTYFEFISGIFYVQ